MINLQMKINKTVEAVREREREREQQSRKKW